MAFLTGAIDHNVIMNAYHSWALFYDEFHFHLKHILGHFDSKWHLLEPVPSLVGVQGGSTKSNAHSSSAKVYIYFRLNVCKMWK